ncbi:hypothetical protein [Niabella ginsenosidivorans]|uniref:hypothetical protein n=1 Tax=Niabella ginsenosidivorans TaxID=1176587 RepID=UPI0012EE10F5|nr:hypothetical protein [Niabella ginsenosidivorans]
MGRTVAVILLGSFTNTSVCQTAHPHILVNASDKQLILDKIARQAWAKKVFDSMRSAIAPYAERHKTDPQWILSRYLMNRVPGKRYTHFYADAGGSALIGYSGDAPFPTVRVSSNKRPPVTKEGLSYKLPTIEQLKPYDTAMLMQLERLGPDARKEWVDPQSFVEVLNGKINQLALEASVIFWLTGEQSYAAFAADILDQWAHGASQQFPVEGACRTGFLSVQSLGDGQYEAMPLIYDFLYDYLRRHHYGTSWYESVFEKIAHTMTFNGFWNNNWFAAQSPAMVFAALSLEDRSRKDFYLNFFLNKDTINGSCGHLALPSVVKKWLTPDGHWKEPGGYHNYPVSNLLIAGLAMEKNGYPIFRQFPQLLRASSVLLKYSFPDLSAPSFGDTGPASQSPECLEIGLLMATKYKDRILPQLQSAMHTLQQKKGYRREASGYMGLLCYLPETASCSAVYNWPRSGALDFAKCYLQRNGTGKEHGLMYAVQGATYNHNHANGMSVELYGSGMVMGVDPGKGVTYEVPVHVNYYEQWAAHNTVISGSRSASVPYFHGGGGAKNIGHITLSAMEPLADSNAISPFCSFTDTRYTDIATRAKQQRTLAIIRLSDSTGYYLDIYRSDHPQDNEYIYHNTGDTVSLLNRDRKPLELKRAAIPLCRSPFDPPGLRYIRNTLSSATGENITALFRLERNGTDQYMQVLFAGQNDRTFYAGEAPSTNTAPPVYRNRPTPAIVCRQQGEAWARPFVAIYEPFAGSGKYSVDRIEMESERGDKNFTALSVYNRDGSRQLILQSADYTVLKQTAISKFEGAFGVINLVKDQPRYLYMGYGRCIEYGKYGIKMKKPGAVNLSVSAKILEISCSGEAYITIKGNKQIAAVFLKGPTEKKLLIEKTADGIGFSVPPVKGGIIQLTVNHQP